LLPLELNHEAYALTELHQWQSTGTERHWLIPLKKNIQYEEIRKLGRNDKLVRLASNPSARQLWPALPETLVVRLVARKIKGKQYDVLTSMEDPMRFPSCDIANYMGIAGK
jgi:hypothetical protein